MLNNPSKAAKIPISNKMRFQTSSALILSVLGILQTIPAFAQLQQSSPIMVDGVITESDAEAFTGSEGSDNNAMVESISPTSSPAPSPIQPLTMPEPQTPLKAAPANVPIVAQLFSSSPGPKQECRGNNVMQILFQQPLPTTATCYNTPSLAQCAKFVANKEDGCQARIFSSRDCVEVSFSNLAVFQPNPWPLGGLMRSVEFTCGIVSVEPKQISMGDVQLPGK